MEPQPCTSQGGTGRDGAPCPAPQNQPGAGARRGGGHHRGSGPGVVLGLSPPPHSHGCSRPARADGKINELITSALHSPKSNPKSQIQPQSQPQNQPCTPGAWQRGQCPPPAPQGWFGEGAAPQFVPSQPQPPPHAPIPSGSACGEAGGALSSPQIEGLLIKVIRAAAWPLPCQRVRGRCGRLGASGEGRGANKSLPRGGTSPGCTDAPSQPSCPLCPTPQDFAPSPGCSHPVLWPRGLI